MPRRFRDATHPPPRSSRSPPRWPRACNPIETYRDVRGINKNDPDPATAPFSGNIAAADAAPYPNLASVPPPPTRATSTADRQKLTESLIAERTATAAAGRRRAAGAGDRPHRRRPLTAVAATENGDRRSARTGCTAASCTAAAGRRRRASPSRRPLRRLRHHPRRLPLPRRPREPPKPPAAAEATPAATAAAGQAGDEQGATAALLQGPAGGSAADGFEPGNAAGALAARAGSGTAAAAAAEPGTGRAAGACRPDPARGAGQRRPRTAAAARAGADCRPRRRWPRSDRRRGARPRRDDGRDPQTCRSRGSAGPGRDRPGRGALPREAREVRVLAFAAAPTGGGDPLASYHAALGRAQQIAKALADAGIPANKIQTEAAPSPLAAGRVDIQFAP